MWWGWAWLTHDWQQNCTVQAVTLFFSMFPRWTLFKVQMNLAVTPGATDLWEVPRLVELDKSMTWHKQTAECVLHVKIYLQSPKERSTKMFNGTIMIAKTNNKINPYKVSFCSMPTHYQPLLSILVHLSILTLQFVRPLLVTNELSHWSL